MITFLSFLLVILGGIDWLLVGLLQYDYVAGLFGYQASIFSRLIYILVGVATLILLFKAFADKGKINLINFKFKFGKKKKQPAPTYNISTEEQKDDEISGKDFSEADKFEYMKEKEQPHDSPSSNKKSNNLLDDI